MTFRSGVLFFWEIKTVIPGMNAIAFTREVRAFLARLEG